MNEEELDFILKEGEGYNIEFKESFSSDISKEICAFANANGGKILIGVSDDKKIKGVKITNSLKSQIQALSRNIDPKLDILITEIGNIIITEVYEGKNKPYSVNGRFYMRQGTNSQQLSRDEIREFFRKEGLILFDEKPNNKFNLEEDFNYTAFDLFLEKSNISSGLSKKEILENLELLEENKMKNAGVLLFCNRISKFFLSAVITCVLFLGKDKVNILDRKEFSGDLYQNYQSAIDYIKSKLNTEYIIKTAGPREEKLELPEEVLKEALLNSIAHRDYFSNAEIQVYIFKDRLEIINPGGLVPGMKISDLGRKSLSRNKLLFGLLQRMNLVEKAGTGILRMRKDMEDYHLKEPKIEADENWFTITFARPDLQKQSYEQRFYGGKTSEKGGQISGQISGQTLTKGQERIFDLIKKNPRITRDELSGKLQINPSAIQKHIDKLKEAGKIKRVGPDKGGYWEVLI